VANHAKKLAEARGINMKSSLEEKIEDDIYKMHEYTDKKLEGMKMVG
jgi:CRISPR/Cas system-associated exonuclease Cas4 (RecB family)